MTPPRSNWSGPVVVHLRQRIQADYPAIIDPKGLSVATAGEHEGMSNQHGAISVRTPGGLLGAYPCEIAWWRYVDSPVRWVWDGAAWREATD